VQKFKLATMKSNASSEKNTELKGNERCAVCKFWDKSTLKYGLCKKLELNKSGLSNLRFEEETTAKIATIMTHKSAVCDAFKARDGRYVSTRTKLVVARRAKNPELDLPKAENTENISKVSAVLKNFFSKKSE
jgi:hypothetical protein